MISRQYYDTVLQTYFLMITIVLGFSFPNVNEMCGCLSDPGFLTDGLKQMVEAFNHVI